MRCSFALRGPRVSPAAYKCFLNVLRQCGVNYDPVLPENPPGDLSGTAAAPFSPLFTTRFDSHQHQLTTLGDALVDCYLSAAVLKYCSRRGITLTANAASELNAVLHNHFTSRLFAKDLQFDAMQMVREDGYCQGNDPSWRSLNFLEVETPVIKRQDIAGTSYQVSLLPSGQSPLGWKFSQFVGALHQSMGLEAATRVLERVYQLHDEPNVPTRASQLLLRVLEHFPAMNVAEGILAVQGLSAHYSARSRVFPCDSEQTPEFAGPPQGAPPGRTSGFHSVAVGDGDKGGVDELAVVAGFSPNRAEAMDITLESLDRGSPLSKNLASGPGVIDAVDVWRRRTHDLVARRLEPAQGAATSLDTSPSSTDGWLSAQERSAYQRGPAFFGSVDVAATPSFADIYGISQPQNGYMVRRTKFKKQVRDPRFYDVMSDARHGVPFDTNGETLTEYLDGFAKPHRRLFEVTMQSAAGGEMKMIGRAISTRYTTARESACRGFLGGVLHDILTLAGASDVAAAVSASDL